MSLGCFCFVRIFKKYIFLVTKHPPGSLQVVNSMCARVRVMFWKSAIPLTNEGCWFSFCSGLLFRRQLSPRCSLRVSLKRRDWEIIWENALCGLSTLVGLRFIQLSYGKTCPPPPPPTLSLLSRPFFPFFFFSFCGLALVICSTQNQQKPQPLDWPYMWKSILRNVALLLIKPGLSVCVCIWGSFFFKLFE